MATIKACPFCGQPAKLLENHYGTIAEYWVICPECRLGTTWHPTEAAAIAAWNQRAGEADYRRLRKLERGLREVMDWPTSLDEVENPSERKIIAIGRLLEGEG